LRALKANLMRTVLSLLSVKIGIFLVIAVLTVVDSLEKSIKDSFSFIGSGVVYVEKWPWLADSNGEYRWWDFWMRPTPSYKEYKFLEENMKHASHVCIFADRGDMIIKRENNSIGQVRLVGGSEGYNNVFEVDVEHGRYFSPEEVAAGRNVAVIGYEVAKALFPNDRSPLGEFVKIKNMRYMVIGVIKQEGASFMGTPSNDFVTVIPYSSFRTLYQTGTGRWDEMQSSIGLKGYDSDIGLVELENEVRGIIRVRRGLRPATSDNFALNRPEALMNIIGQVFDVLSLAGWLIGGFAMLVGGFGIANIMFVSVKERTPIIGLQKSLGAKNFFILFQFLFEAMFISLIGGVIALLLLAFLLLIVPTGSLVVKLTLDNIVLGIGVSTLIGIVSGIIPAAMAARLDPVTAIRAA
jgi:putative ABC transport system permease protein